MTDINTKITSISFDEDGELTYEDNTATIHREQYVGVVVVDMIGKTFEIEEIKTLLKHMEYLDKLEGEE